MATCEGRWHCIVSMATGETVYLGKSVLMAANKLQPGTMLGVGPSPSVAKTAAHANRQASLDVQDRAAMEKARAKRMHRHMAGAITSNGSV